MEAEKWQAIKRIVSDALELPLDERAAYVEVACARQSDLRQDVEAILRAHHVTDQFLEMPAVRILGDLPAPDLPQSWKGATVGSYHIVEEIGRGGMGVIYKAEDTRLGRSVALKFLPQELAGDRDSRARFEREAHAASALNHPNICTIYAVDEYAGQPFIAMELLKGQTLKEVIQAGRIRIE